MTGIRKARLAVVEDDDMLRPILAENLVHSGYEVHEFADGESALASLRDGDWAADLLILDWKMPGMSGLDLLRQLREAKVTAAALFFTSHNDTVYEEAALTYGAVDFVDKTRSFAILQKRIELVLARGGEAETISGGGRLRIDSSSHSVRWRNATIALTFGEFRVVELLVQAGRDVTYREIYDTLRGDNFIAGEGPEGYRANVRALIKRIREKFAAADPGFDAIANFPGFGYRWVRDGDDA